MVERANPGTPPPAILADYAVRPGAADELFDASGAMRPVWRGFIDQLARLSPEAVAESFARGDRYLRDAGVFYRRYSADPQQERDWPLSHIPVLLQEDEWAEICAGLEERAELLEHVVADLYGPARLVEEEHLPAELVAQNPEWHRALVGIPPVSGHYLHLIAFEIGRSPDGSWLVLGDRTQAPSGAGFALENRRATARIFPEPFPRARVLRLARFFRAFRDGLEALPGANGRRLAILTPGPGNETYFEHAYIARYLGLALLEGEDLIVHEGEVQVRTVSGPQPVGVLWRRLDAGFADPLELLEHSRIGTPGLVDALRQNAVTMVNALGSGILETRAFMAFLPRIARAVLGREARLPSLATWWCGQPAERAYVRDNAEAMFLSQALSRALPFDIGTGAEPGGPQTRAEGQSLADWIEAQGAFLVGQEAVTLSTTPVWEDGRLVPRPMSIRVFAARTPTGWTFMPGGYARIGRQPDTTALAMQQGGSVADVWVMRDAPAPGDTLMGQGAFRREDTGMLPSRAADNLFWLGRYVERAEGQIRLLRAYHLRLAEIGGAEDARLAAIAERMAGIGTDIAAPLSAAVAPALDAARRCAARVRDRFSVDGWAALADLTSSLAEMSGALAPGDDSARALGVLLRKITGFNGLVHENMHRSSGWRFLTLGRALERADGAAAVLSVFAVGAREPGLPDLALEYGDSHNAHQRRYRADASPDTVIDLMALDADNPRAILYQVVTMRRIAETLPHEREGDRASDLMRALLPLEAELAVSGPDEIGFDRLMRLRGELAEISRRLTRLYLT
jgi:uncharacterized circularly permuted ATP-grasp superfamily protein/uncharacterized alpha-E superfamily protein